MFESGTRWFLACLRLSCLAVRHVFVRPKEIDVLCPTDGGGPGFLADPGPFPRFMALPKYALGVQRLGLPRGRLPDEH